MAITMTAVGWLLCTFSRLLRGINSSGHMHLRQREQAMSRVRRPLIVSVVLLAGGMSGPARGEAADGSALRPVAVWPSSPLEVMVAFDRPVDAEVPGRLAGRSIAYRSTRLSAPNSGARSGAIKIAAARLANDRRTLIIATDPHSCAGQYSLLLDTTAPAGSKPDASSIWRYDLSGVDASWSPEDPAAAEAARSIWWPLLDSERVHANTAGSRRHEELETLLVRPGQLVLSTYVTLPAGSATLHLESNSQIEEAGIGDVQAEPAEPDAAPGRFRASLQVASQGEPLFLTVTLRTRARGSPFFFKATYRTGQETADHPLEQSRLFLPWAPVATAAPNTAPALVPDLSGGDAAVGRAIFFGDRARCSQCHAFGGQGAQIGPDLSELGKKGRAEIFRAIAAPSTAIDPAYLSFTIATRDGRVAVGIVRAEGADKIRITDTNAHATLIDRGQIQQIRPSTTSIMPAGLAAALGDTTIRDLIAFLNSPPHAPRDNKQR
jgi:putative heme-binding domain-containing protein